MSKPSDWTVADEFLTTLEDAGVSYLFVNLGSDHTAIIEGVAKSHQHGYEVPEVVTCPHESVALNTAMGYAQLTGEPQAVVVHVDVGTLNLGGAIHNAARARVPVLLFAGLTPMTLHGERRGSRDIPVAYLQDVFDQPGSVREYVKGHYEIKTGDHCRHLVERALQIARSNPEGPVYMTATREVLEESFSTRKPSGGQINSSRLGTLPVSEARRLLDTLNEAENPLLITSYLGRRPEAVQKLVQFSEAMACPVIEEDMSRYLNFPTDHPLHLGFRKKLREMLPNCDAIVVLDCDVPWVPSKVQPREDASFFFLDVDPVKERIPLWRFPNARFHRVDSFETLDQLLRMSSEPDDGKETELYNMRLEKSKKTHRATRETWKNTVSEEQLTPTWLAHQIGQWIDPEDILVNETVTFSPVIRRLIPRTRPGTLFNIPASSLGYGAGAALGMKLGKPDQRVILLCGDGSFYYGVPSSVYWMSARYDLPFLTIVFNNGGWGSPRLDTLNIHPEGYASQQKQFGVELEPRSDLGGIAQAAGGALGATVHRAEEFTNALRDAEQALAEGRSAVIDVRLESVSDQKVDLKL